MKRIFYLIASAIITQWSFAQTVNLGADAVINSITTNSQSNTAVAVDSATGTYFVVWESLSSSGVYNIYGRTVDRLGSTLGSDLVIGNLSNGRFPDVAESPTGNAVIVWSSCGPDGDEHGIFGRLVSANGTRGPSFSVNSTTSGNQKNPSVGIADNGNFVVVWASEGQDGSSFGIYGQRFNSSGVKVGPEFLINNLTVGYQGYPDVAVAGDGSFVVVWQSNGTDGSGNGVYARRYTSSGAAVATQFLINTTTSGNQQEPTVAIKKNGDFGFAWSSYGQDGDEYGIYAIFYNSSGSVVNSEFKVNTLVDGNQGHVDMTTTPGGRYLLTYTNDTSLVSLEGVYLAAYDSLGVSSFTPELVNTRTSDYQQFSSIASFSDDTMMIAYQDGLRESSSTADGDDYAIVSHLVDFSSIPVPVTLLDFTASAMDQNSAILNWATATEINNSHFTIQRSLDGVYFNSLTDIKGQGNTSAISTYSYIDVTIPNQTKRAYYRLKQVDFDGVSEYSVVRPVDFDIIDSWTSSVNLYPNPLTNTLFVHLVEVEEIVDLSLFSISGQLLLEEKLAKEMSSIDISQLNAGSYFVRLVDKENTTHIQKLIKY